MNPILHDNLVHSLNGKKIILGITGSIAAFKACDIIRFLKDCGAEVRVLLSASGEKFVTPLTLETLSGNPVRSSLWADSSYEERAQGTHHIDAARWADLFLIAPATANLIAKYAQGLADDLITTELLATTSQVAIVPAMNPEMWNHPATQSNVELLKTRGVHFFGPISGKTACGELGLGRMIEPDEIVEKTAYLLSKRNAIPKKILITLGPTRSFLDPVRFLTNRSSGLMGAAFCFSAIQKGYSVVAICGPNSAPLPRHEKMKSISITTAEEMRQCVHEFLPEMDIFISCSAVLDWDFKNFSDQKLKKDTLSATVELKPNKDILGEASQAKQEGKTHSFILGFAAETQNWLDEGKKKLTRKGCDAIFVNDVSQTNVGFESLQNAGVWLDQKGNSFTYLSQNKSELALKLLDRIEEDLHKQHHPVTPQPQHTMQSTQSI